MTTDKIDRARNFAHVAHDSIGQKRKYSGEPYWVHTDEVAKIVHDDVFHRLTELENLVCAAHLHDVLEDVATESTDYSVHVLYGLFGAEITALVVQLTDVFTKDAYPHLNRAQRKAAECQRWAVCSPEAKTIKLADLISNSRDILERDPKFAVTYLAEKNELLKVLVGGSPFLMEQARKIIGKSC